ncbi:MAG: 50S ribosomal protein L29 [archaeon]
MKELKNLGKKQLEEKLAEAKKELLKVNAKIATKVVPDNPGNIKQIKKTIAKIFTIKKQNKTEDKNKAQ